VTRALPRSFAFACAALALACKGPGVVPEMAPLATDVHFAPIVPDDADRASADLAVSAFAGNAEGARDALDRIERFDREREAEGEQESGLAPIGQDLFNAAAVPGRNYLDASDALLERRDVDPATRERLERNEAGDPLERADARIRDARMGAFARFFNAFVEPVGKSAMTTALAPVRLGLSLARYGIDLYRQDPLPLQRRQALAMWKDFLARYPDEPDSPEVARKTERAEERWQGMLKQRSLDAGRQALDDGRPSEAAALARRALRTSPGDRGAERLLARANEMLGAQRTARTASSRFELAPGAELAPDGTRDLAVALLDPRGNVRAIVAAIPDESPIAEEARYARALALSDARYEDDAEALLEAIAGGDGPMARHARATLSDPQQSPWRHFESARARDRRHATRFVVTGPARLPELTPDGVALWLLGLPGMASSIATFPLRLSQLPWLPPPPSARITALQAERYLAHHPDGEHADAVRDWLEDYESDRGNHVAALRVAEARQPQPDLDPMREQAAKQSLEVAKKEERLDLRAAMYDAIAQRFPNTKAAGEAKELLRLEIEHATPQRIAMSRRFLIENPSVAGVQGLGLDPSYLDGSPRNGELHPDGVALIGGRQIELSFVGESGDEDDAAETRSVRVSAQQLARVVSRLEETSFRNSLLDAEDPVVPDSRRDIAFERARLGLADRVDRRPEARADFTYTGMRERYGMVRAREPWLPFDLVVQGSLADLSLGAFPRWREPKKTPDAALYE
jgi:hypothetical protein